MKNKHLSWFYSNREERSKWLVERFEKTFREADSVLDVGCWERDIQKNLHKNIDYTGIDIAGNPDKVINLDNVSKLPFSDNKFDVTVCADVLEHIENIHLIFDEICRVTKNDIIITLPNPLFSLWSYLFKKKYKNSNEERNKFGKYVKFYGLPEEKPDDRHRWFFSFEEALDFLKYKSNKNNFSLQIAETDLEYDNRILKKAIKNIIAFILHRDFVRKKSVFLITN